MSRAVKYLLVLGVPPLALAGGLHMYRKRLADNKAVSPEDFNGAQREKILEVLASEDVLRSRNLTLYQYTTCPFCNKVKAFLECNNVPYSIVEVDPLFKTEVKESGYGKVPQLRLGDDGPLLVDSDHIVDNLSPVLMPHTANLSPEAAEERQKWTDWANNVLARYLVINTNRTIQESFQGYDYVNDVQNFGVAKKLVLKLVGGASMYLVSELLTKKRLAQYGYSKEKDARECLYTELDSWVASLSQKSGKAENKVLHGGVKPDRSDIEVYGILQSVRRYPVYNDIKGYNSSLNNWLDEMDKISGKQNLIPRE